MESRRALNRKPSLTGNSFFDFCRGHEIRKIFSIIFLILIVINSAVTIFSGQWGLLLFAPIQFGLWYYIARNSCAPILYFLTPILFIILTVSMLFPVKKASQGGSEEGGEEGEKDGKDGEEGEKDGKDGEEGDKGDGEEGEKGDGEQDGEEGEKDEKGPPTADQLTVSDKTCCFARIATCLACEEGKTVKEYCAIKGNAQIPGCSQWRKPVAEKKPRACCRAMSAECLACSKGITVDEYCAIEKYAQEPWCSGLNGPNKTSQVIIPEAYDPMQFR